MVAQECRQRLRQMFGQTGRIGEQMDAGLGAAGESGEIAAHRIDIMNDDPGMIEQAFAGRGQFDAAAAALQQFDAERRLEALDPRAGRGQREMDGQRAARDAAAVGHRDEQLQVNQIETHRHRRGSSAFVTAEG